MKFAVTVESVFVEWSVDGCLLTFCFPPYDYAECVKSAVADRIRRHGYRLEIGCTLFHIISFLKGCSALTGGPKVVYRVVVE